MRIEANTQIVSAQIIDQHSEQPLKQIRTDFIEVWNRIKNRRDISALADAYLDGVNREAEWIMFYFVYHCDHHCDDKNGWKFMLTRWEQIRKARAAREARRVKTQAKAEAKLAKAKSKSIAKTKAKAKAKAKARAKIDQTDTLSKVSREADCAEHLLLRENFKNLSETEAKMQTETWTVLSKMDTIMLTVLLNAASKFQAGMKNGALAPQPMQLTTDACFPPLI